MSSSESPSFFTISAAEFDGVTPLTAVWQPNASPRSQPRSYAAQSLVEVGRISYAKLGQPGTMGQLVTARCQLDAALVTLSVRSENATEAAARPVPDVPAPNNLDVVLDTRNLTTVWCAPFLMGPTDAIALTGGSQAPLAATVDIITVDLHDAAALSYLNAVFAAASTTPSTTSVRVVTASETVSPFAGTQYILGTAAAVSMTLTLPLASAVVAGTTLIVTRVGGGWISVIRQGADTINGAATAVILEDIGQVTFTMRSGQWLASEAPITTDVTVSNAVADTTVALPVVTSTTLVSADFTARGILQLPTIANVADGVEYLLQRTTDSATVFPARVKVTTFAVGDTLDGVANGYVLLGSPGAVIRIRKISTGWVVVSERGCSPLETIDAPATATVDSGWVGLKNLNATQVAPQTLTLPVAALLDSGCQIRVNYPLAAGLGAGTLTIDAGIIPIVGGGASATTMVLAYNESADLCYDGTDWHLIRSAPTVKALVEAANRVMLESWNGLRIFRCNQAAAQTMTLIAATAAFIGQEAHFVSLGAGGLTINGGGTNIIGEGATAAAKAIAQNTCIRVVSDGTNWLQTV